jgi:UDP-4-amino-4-deoxy-L-arabinose formyltransferase/UDP-glucuronic acid dehydrogenase (UDP-4-keto-hexauronic acid decarboxylating)
MRFAALGRTRWLYDAIRACCERGHQVTLIGTSPPAPEYTVDERQFARQASELGAAFFCDPRINTPLRLADARASGAEVAISVNWPGLLGAELRAAFCHGVVNAHAGDLPRYRGNACPNWAILRGEREVVLTLHEMVDELDAGPILLQRRFPLSEQTYVSDVYRFLDAAVPELFADLLDGVEAGTITARPQPTDPRLSLRCFPRRPGDGRIDWREPAEQLARLVRASAEPFAGAFTSYQGERVVIWRARAEPLPRRMLGLPGQIVERRDPAGEVAVLTGDGLLVVEEVETAESGRQPGAQLVRSTRGRFEDTAAAELRALRARVAELEARLAAMSGDGPPVSDARAG